MDDYLPANTSITTPLSERPLEDMTRPPVMQAPARDYGVDTSTSTNQQPDVGVWRAGWELDTIPGAMMNRRDAGISFEDDGTDPFAENKGTKFELMPEYFTDIFNTQALAARRAQIEREQELRAVQDRSPWGAAGASLALQLVDPTMLIPGANLVKVGRGVYRFAGSAAKVGAAAAGATAVQEAVLQSQQQLRTGEESAIAIGGSFVLGGMLGGGLSLLTKPEIRKATTGLDSILNTRPGPDGAVASGSAVALTDMATKLRAGERVTTEEVQEWAKSARIEARNGRDATPETIARWEEIDRLSAVLEREASVARASEIEVAARTAFGGDGDRLVRGGGLQVVQSVEDLPARSDGLAHPTDVRGVFDGNKAYIVADNVTPDEVPSVLLHEVGVHFGMEKMVGAENFRVLLDDVTNRAAAGEARFAEALAAVPNDTPAQHQAEEVLAYLVESAPELGIVQRVIAAVKQFIRQVSGGSYAGLSEADIRQLAVAALRKWNPEAKPSEIRYARGTRSAEVKRSLPDLVAAAREMTTWNDWYERYQADLQRLFGSDTALIQKMLSVTSQSAQVQANVTLALKAYRQYLAGEPFEGYLGAVRMNLERIRNEEAIRGQKIAEYSKANEGDADGIAVDRHIAQLLFDETKSPTAAQVAAAKGVIRQIAAELGWDAKGVQAALWAYNIVRKGGKPQSYDTFLRAKEAEIQALRARYGRGEGEGIPDGGPVGGASGGAGAAAEDAGRVAGISGQPADVRYSRAKTDTPEFKKWFGKSKVVDADGKPLVVYHGTNRSFSAFDKNKKSKVKTDAPSFAHYFSSSPKTAGTYAKGSGKNIIPAYLSLQNPLIVDLGEEGGQWAQFTSPIGGDIFDLRYNQLRTVGAGDLIDINTLTLLAKKQGYDGLVVKNVWDAASERGADKLQDTYVAFEPTQIKSATGNDGSFSPDNPDIRFSRGASRNERIAAQLEELAKALATVDDAEAFAKAFAGRGAAAGAEFTDQPSLEDLTVAGKGARAYAAATKFMNPTLRANFRAVPAARADMQRLAENSVFQQMHLDNRTLGPSVETQMRAEYRSRIIAAAQAADEIWQEARKAGLRMTRRQFDEAVGMAMRREDVGENDFVTRAAQSYRKEMFDHFKVMAQNTRGSDGKSLLPEDLQVVGAPSYLTRMPNYERLVNDEMGFKRTVASHYEAVFRGEYQKAADATRARLAALDQEISDLKLSPEDRVATMDAIDKRLAEIETANAREIDLLARINTLRQQATKAAESGN